MDSTSLSPEKVELATISKDAAGQVQNSDHFTCHTGILADELVDHVQKGVTGSLE